MPVVDTSVVLASLLNEPAAAVAMDALRQGEAHAPDILPLEVANALVTAVRRQRLTRAQVRPCLDLLGRMPVRLHPTPPLVSWAVDLSLTWDRRPFDGVFVILAQVLDTQCLTLDQKLVQGLAGSPWAHRVRLLGG